MGPGDEGMLHEGQQTHLFFITVNQIKIYTIYKLRTADSPSVEASQRFETSFYVIFTL